MSPNIQVSTISVFLTSEDGCTGRFQLYPNDGPTEWDNGAEPTLQTVKAEFECVLMQDDDQKIQSATITGEQWRALENRGREAAILRYLEAGGSLEKGLLMNGNEHFHELRIYDNKGQTFDRYTVVYMNEPDERQNGLYACRGMSEHPTHPQGFGLYSDAVPGLHLGERITFTDLPEDCQKLVLSDLEISNFDPSEDHFQDLINAGVDDPAQRDETDEDDETTSRKEQLSKSFGYYINLDERGEFYADVRNHEGKTVYEIHAGPSSSEEDDESSTSNIFEDGFMKDKNDISGLQNYLQSVGIIPADGALMTMTHFEELESQVAEDDAAKIREKN